MGKVTQTNEQGAKKKLNNTTRVFISSIESKKKQSNTKLDKKSKFSDNSTVIHKKKDLSSGLTRIADNRAGAENMAQRVTSVSTATKGRREK